MPYTLPDRTRPPAFRVLQDFPLPKCELRWLDNGVQVWVMRDDRQGVCDLQVVYKAGRLHEYAPGSSLFCSKTLFSGTSNQTSGDINKEFELHGGYWQIQTGFELFTIHLYCMAENIRPILEQTKKCLIDPVFPFEDFEMQRNLILQQTKVNLEKNAFLASRKYNQLLFGAEHPFGYKLSLEQIGAYELTKAKNHYATCIQEAPFALFYSGTWSEQVFTELNETLGQLTINKAEPGLEPPEMQSTLQHAYHQEVDDSVQTSLRIGKIAYPIDHPDKIAAEVVNEVFGGYFGSRLMKNIRENKGYTYGIYSSITYLHGTGMFTVSSDVIKDKLQDTLNQVSLEMERMKQEKVPYSELDTVKNYMAGEYLKSISSASTVINYHKMLWLHKLPVEFYDNYVSQIQETSAERVMERARILLRDNMLQVTVG
jgi:predicted Zn-dependent peptidase